MDLLRTRAAAEKLGLSPRTLEKWRVQGRGPRFYKLGSSVAYGSGDLDAWLARRSRISTSDTGERA